MEKMQKELEELKKNPEKVRAMIALLESLLDEQERSYFCDGKDSDIRKMVVYHLHNLGICGNYKGYKFVREGLVIAFKDPSVLERITKDFYPIIAKKFKTTSSKIERTIRTVIEVAWQKADRDILKLYFGNNQERPTNGDFLARLLEILQVYGGKNP